MELDETPYTYINIGDINQNENKFNKALKNYKQALKVYNNNSDRYSNAVLAYILEELGSVYFTIIKDKHSHNIDLTNKEMQTIAESYFSESLQNYIKSNVLNKASELYYKMYEYYDFLKDFENSSIYLKSYVEIKDSLFNSEKIKEINKITNEREQLLKQLDQQREQEIIDERNRIQYSIISIITVLIFVVIFYFISRNVSFGAIDTLTFVAFLLLYEFILVVTEPWVDNLTDNIPIYKLLINIGIALILIPLQKLEHSIKGKIKKQ